MIPTFRDRLRSFFSVRELYLEELRDRWGRHVDTYRDRADIALLYVLTRDDAISKSIDDTTWFDLDMDAIFDRLDGNTTPIGRQYLFRQLRTLEPDEAKLRSQFEASRHFKANRVLREEVQLNMWLLKSSNASSVTGMLFGERPTGDFPHALAWCLAGMSLVAIAIVVISPALFWLLILTIGANFVFAEAYAHRIGRHSVSFVYLRNLLIVAARLSGIDHDEPVDQLDYLKDNRHRIHRLRGEFRIVGLDSTSDNVITAQLAYFLNLICLFDFLVFMRCHRRLIAHQEELSRIYFAVAGIDSAVAVASYLDMTSNLCNPQFGARSDLQFDAVTHPLLEDAIPNDYDSSDTSALITGSNMAGKSTFIKAIGTNLILAQTLWFCHARSAVVPKATVMSSIKRSDSLEEGKSYYFAEIEALLRLIVASNEDEPHVFLIDEILHGTNTIERVACSAAILNQISNGHTVMVTSHDVELSRLLSARYRSFHFRETSDLDNMFDYRLRDGHCTTRNAITLLEAIGFPADVIGEARTFASELDR